ncbi:MAG: DUF2892 domain-containing protein [Anaerolineae bacterium]|nr:DUF2892 domain-containing protein [Anaerolineae bacterium]
MFSHNVGNTDRIVRIVLGLVIVAAGLYFQSWLALLAIIPLGTALLGTCPLYSIFGFSTCPVQTKA